MEVGQELYFILCSVDRKGYLPNLSRFDHEIILSTMVPPIPSGIGPFILRSKPMDHPSDSDPDISSIVYYHNQLQKEWMTVWENSGEKSLH